uniref:Uncharacterized protein n=1 Tax=Heterorhabditis bacteriophora TaxID=37862 RepID=A0A1I7WVV0_HETBA
MLETFHTEDVSAKHRNRRERQFSMKLVLICWNTNEITVADFPERQWTVRQNSNGISPNITDGAIRL